MRSPPDRGPGTSAGAESPGSSSPCRRPDWWTGRSDRARRRSPRPPCAPATACRRRPRTDRRSRCRCRYRSRQALCRSAARASCAAQPPARRFARANFQAPLLPPSSIPFGWSRSLLLNANHLYLRHGHHSNIDHLFNDGHECGDSGGSIHDGDLDGRLVPAFHPPQDRRPGDLQFAALRHNGFVERLALVAVGFGDVNPQDPSGLALLHRIPPRLSGSGPAGPSRRRR